MTTRREVFKKGPLWKGTFHSIGTFLRHLVKPPPTVHATGHVQAGSVALAASAVGVSTSSDDTLDDRVARLETDVSNLRKRVSDTERNVLHLSKDMENRVNRERDKRQADLLEVRKLIEEAVIGGIHLELGGLVDCL